MRIIPTAKFERNYKKLSDALKDKAEIALDIFKNDPADARLRVHKLQGRFCDYWAFSVDYGNRVIFRYGNDGEVFLITVGDHDIYK
jgi:mRNA-degrading endonuclease YafQ of YafQ-DinJ toxin-antitoxin module